MKIIECSRDAMQGIKDFIPTETKISYLNQLMKVGFEVLDCGSFVSPKMIPQMQDTENVLQSITQTDTKISVIVANLSGAKKAIAIPKIDYLGFPFSISETFQQRNTNKSREDAFDNIQQIHTDLQASKKEIIVYISMAFGNPYKDDWSLSEIEKWVEKFSKLGIKTLILSDTVGMANEKNIQLLFENLLSHFSALEFGAHFHTQYHDWEQKVSLAYKLGCRRFDGAIKGYGGCPMAKNELVGNMPTEHLFHFLQERKILTKINETEFKKSIDLANEIFTKYH